MSLLFTETAVKKPSRTAKKSLLKIVGGLSSKQRTLSNPFLDIFREVPSVHHVSSDPSIQLPEIETGKGNRILRDFIESDEDLRSRVTLVPNSDPDLSEAEAHEASLESARAVDAAIVPVQRAADELSRRMKTKMADFERDFRTLCPHRPDSFAQRFRFAGYRALFDELVAQVANELDRFTDFAVKIGGITRLVQAYPDVTLRARFASKQVKVRLETWETQEKYVRLETALAQERRCFKDKGEPVRFEQCFELAPPCSDAAGTWYPELGGVERIFGDIVGSFVKTERGVARIVQEPGAAGRVALDLANDACVKNEALLPRAFLMAARYLFARIYTDPGPADPEFLRRISTMRQFAPVAFDVNPAFLNPRLRMVALVTFPVKNLYREAIDLLRIAVFQYNPVDFCHVVHSALVSIQKSASVKSWKTQEKQTGMLQARGDHLLSFDDLFEIELIVWLLAEPAAFQPLIAMFEPSVPGLELTSELDFAFTNISALVAHVMELDFEQFVAKARTKSKQAVESEPLNVLSS
jgi:hypothetical protein